MRVLHIVNSLAVGGLEKFVVDLTNQMDQVDHTVVCLTDRGDFFYDVKGDAIFLDVPEKLSISTINKIRSIIKRKSINIVHTHNQRPQLYGAIAARLTGTPIIHTKHGQNQSCFNRRTYMDIFSSYLTNTIVTVSNDAHRICLEKLRIAQNKVVTILNGVNTNTYRRLNEKTPYDNDRPFIIGTVARLSPEKNQSSLLDACSIMMKKSINFKLKIVGAGSLKQELMDKAKQLALDEFVVFEGMRRNIPAVMNTFDLFVLPSLTEGVPLTLLEAMACELPVVATDVGGNSEVVADGITGFLVPSDCPDSLANAIMKFIRDPGIGFNMGSAGRKRVIEKFSLLKTSAAYFEQYKKILPTYELK